MVVVGSATMVQLYIAQLVTTIVTMATTTTTATTAIIIIATIITATTVYKIITFTIIFAPIHLHKKLQHQNPTQHQNQYMRKIPEPRFIVIIMYFIIIINLPITIIIVPMVITKLDHLVINAACLLVWLNGP